jgi:hypothetical protein
MPNGSNVVVTKENRLQDIYLIARPPQQTNSAAERGLETIDPSN